MWAKGSGGADQQVTLAQMIEAGQSLFDVASVEMTLIDRQGRRHGRRST